MNDNHNTTRSIDTNNNTTHSNKGNNNSNTFKMDKYAEELVTQGRLKLIEKETRSIGALLDKRHMYEIEEPGRMKLRESSLAKKEAAVRTGSRRNARTADDIKSGTEAAIAALRKKGITLATLVSQGFENEELIWKTKANDPQYTIKRKFNHPELQSFRESFDSDQKKIFKEKCLEALTNLAQKYRDEVWEIKDQMDSAAIFHPDANTQRAHCIYLMKLYKGITSETIEDPVLRNMMEEINAISRRADLEKRRNEKLLKLAAGESLDDDSLELEKKPNTKMKKDKIPIHMRKSASTNEKLTISKVNTMKSSKSTANITKDTKMNIDKVINNNNTQDDKIEKANDIVVQLNKAHSEISSEGKLESNNVRDIEKERFQSQTEKMFSKIKRGRLGGADPRAFLEDEAKKLEMATVSTDKKGKDRSVLFDEKVSEWMLSTLQNNQISKTSDGKASLSDSLSWQNDSIGNSFNVTTIPQQTVPFEEFYTMFREYSANNLQSNEDINIDIKTETIEEKSTNYVAPVVPTDIITQLAEDDSKFGAFLKLNNKEKLKGSNILGNASGSTIKLRRVRTIAPLGKTAVLLMDSKGQVKKLSSQGFKNYFVDPTTATEEDSTMSQDDEKIYQKEVHDFEYTMTTTATEMSVELEGTAHGGIFGDHEFAATEGRSSPARSPLSRFGKSRTRSRRRTTSSIDGSGGEDVPEMQSKLTCAWELMQVPMIARLAFLRKYSTVGYSPELEAASDLLAQISILVAFRKEILKYKKKLQQKCINFPLREHQVIQSVSRRLPSTFLDLSSIFSSVAEKIKIVFSETYDDVTFDDKGEEEQLANNFFANLLLWVNDFILDKLEYAHSNLGDIIPYGNGTLREWLEKG